MHAFIALLFTTPNLPDLVQLLLLTIEKKKKRRKFLVCEITLYIEDGDKFLRFILFFLKALLDVHFTAELYQGIIPQDR